jgi:hypothetical protein
MHRTIRHRHRRGSALITVVALCAVMGLLAASMLRYTATERRGNERNRLALRAKNIAENVAIYASEQLTTKLYRIGSAPEMHFDWTGSGANRIYPPPDSVLTSAFSSPANVELRAGIEEASAYELVTDTTSPNYDLQVSTAKVPIIAKATVSHPALGTMTSYVQQDMELALAPLFQFGMFYNSDLELYPSVAFTLAGPVHSNKRIMAMHDGSSNINITFLKRVTSAEGFYADATIKAPTRGATGGLTTVNYTVGQIYLYHTNGTQTSLKNSSSKWRDHKYTTSTETTTTIANFRTFATNTYNGNLRTSAHGVTPLELPGIGSYKEENDPATPEDDRSNGRQIIEPPNADVWVWDTATSTGSWVANTDDGDAIGSKIAYKAGLFIMVNPDDNATPRKGTLPDGTVAWVLPHSYRAWINYTDSSGDRQCDEVVLPGQPTYGYGPGADGTTGTADDVMYRNYLPNRYTELSVGGNVTGNQVLRIPQFGYGQSRSYLLNGAKAVGDTALSVDTGTGPILAGEVITIGSYRYLVASDHAGGAGTLTIAAPGLLAAAADDATITVNPYGSRNIPSPGYKTYKSSGSYATGTTQIDLRLQSSGTGGVIYPGTAITIGSFKYLVTAAGTSTGITSGNYTTTSYTIGVAPLRASVASNVNVTIDATPFDLGTGLGYRVNGSVSSGADTLTLDTGGGTILVGDTIFVDGARHLVTSTAATPPSSAPTIQIYPAADGDGIADNDPVIVDPFKLSGYSRSTVWPVANTGTAFPADSTAPYVAADAYFFDMRRANANSGVRGLSGTTATYDRFSQTYKARACAKIDFDMTRLKLMVERVMNAAVTASIYDVRAPNATGVTFTNSIFNASGTKVTAGLGISDGAFAPANFDIFPTTTDADTRIRPDPFNLYYAPTNPEVSGVSGNLDEILDDPMDFLVPASALYDDSVPDAWYDGVAVYINSVDAEKRAQTSNVPDRIDSGVRIWNGRGPVVSLTAATKTGFTLVTNDALYTVGHFNADGTIDSSTTDTGSGSPNYYGGYSAQYPDSADEKLAALMADAFTPLSHPTWTSSSSGQVNGWNDALSAFPVSAANSSWESTSSASGTLNGSFDGVYAAAAVIRPGLLPNSNYSGSLGSTTNLKLGAVNTEISAATLMGVVPSNHDPRQLTDGYVPSTFSTWGTPARAGNGVNSGGANNFPRLLESWSGDGLYIRGSIVALYESRVAMEPFTNSRCYQAPGRYWGLHYNFSQASHDVPLEPIVIGSTRVGFRELSKAEYDAKKTVIEAL